MGFGVVKKLLRKIFKDWRVVKTGLSKKDKIVI